MVAKTAPMKRGKDKIPLRSKRKVDHYLGLALTGFFEVIAFAMGRVLRRDHRNVPFDRVIVMKFIGMGSLASAYPSILALKKSNKDMEMIFWGTRQTTGLAKELGVFSKVIELDDTTYPAALASIVRNLLEIRAFRPSWAFDLEIYSKLSSVLCLWTMAVNRVGFISDTTGFRKYLHTHLAYFNRLRYVGDLYNRMLLGFLPGGHAPVAVMDYSRELNVVPDKGGRVAVNVNSGELFSLRRWPAASFSLLIEKILEEYRCEVVLTGSASEHEYVEELREMVPEAKRPRVVNLAGKLDLRELMGLLKGSRLFVTNDSGPLHLALLMNTPVVALFGPTHPVHLLPAGRENVLPIYHGYICSPCVHVIEYEYLPCKGEAPCMKAIGVDEVWAAAKRLLDAATEGKLRQLPIRGTAKVYERE